MFPDKIYGVMQQGVTRRTFETLMSCENA